MRVLDRLDRLRRQEILAAMGGALTPSPRQSPGIGGFDAASSEVQAAILELKRDLRLAKDDWTEEAIRRLQYQVFHALQKIAYSPKEIAGIRGRLVERGLVPPAEVPVDLGRNRSKYLRRGGLMASDVVRALKSEHMEEDLIPPGEEGGVASASLFLTRGPSTGSRLLIIASRDVQGIHVLDVFRVVEGIVKPALPATPGSVMKAFAEEYGVPFKCFGQAVKLVLRDNFGDNPRATDFLQWFSSTVGSGQMNMPDFLDMFPVIDEPLVKRDWIAITLYVRPSTISPEISILFMLNEVKYVSSLQSAGLPAQLSG